jgi:NAD(P)-dependent dehydrogenase (short-subunit alcohol dehydrogenase family)
VLSRSPSRGRGAEVFLSARSTDPLKEIATSIEEAHGRLDVLVNNAGISPYFVPSERLTEANLTEVLATNLVGTFGCCRAGLPLFEESEVASIVNVSSIHADQGQERLLAYSASKGGLEMVTRTLAIEWVAMGIRVNSLAPGYIETEMTEGLLQSRRWSESLLAKIPMGRFATTAEIVAAAMFLASPISSYVTGTTLIADGGWSAG